MSYECTDRWLDAWMEKKKEKKMLKKSHGKETVLTVPRKQNQCQFVQPVKAL